MFVKSYVHICLLFERRKKLTKNNLQNVDFIAVIAMLKEFVYFFLLKYIH